MDPWVCIYDFLDWLTLCRRRVCDEHRSPRVIGTVAWAWLNSLQRIFPGDIELVQEIFLDELTEEERS